MTLPLSNKIALVTGGSRGIGAAIVKKLASHGAQVVFTYSKSATEADALANAVAAAGGKATPIQTDAADAKAQVKLANDVAKQFGTIDILVNNAGLWSQGLIGEIDAEEYHRLMAVNVEGVFALTNAAVPHMKAGSRIINISSVLGERAIGPGLSVYNASKFAVTGFSRSWARDLAPKGILVNAVQPGPIDTDMNPADSDYGRETAKTIPLGRYGKTEELAGAVAFFAGPDATFVTGATLNVDGGVNA